jgi:hypothetical protein
MPLFDNETTTENENLTPDTPVVEEEQVIEEEKNLPEVTLIVEDGSGISDSNSYCDLDFALEYCVNHGYTSWIDMTEDEQKVYLIKGTSFVDNFYEWKGYKRTSVQSLEFPRNGLIDNNRTEILGIPNNLKKAVIEAAFINLSSEVDNLFVSRDENGAIKRQKVDELEVEYFGESEVTETEAEYKTTYQVLNKLLKGLYKEKEMSSVCTKAIWRW